jgi:hypothetical protein
MGLFTFEKTGCLTLLAMLLVIIVGSYAYAADQFDWKRYKGQTIVAAFETPWLK